MKRKRKRGSFCINADVPGHFKATRSATTASTDHKHTNYHRKGNLASEPTGRKVTIPPPRLFSLPPVNRGSGEKMTKTRERSFEISPSRKEPKCDENSWKCLRDDDKRWETFGAGFRLNPQIKESFNDPSTRQGVDTSAIEKGLKRILEQSYLSCTLSTKSLRDLFRLFEEKKTIHFDDQYLSTKFDSVIMFARTMITKQIISCFSCVNANAQYFGARLFEMQLILYAEKFQVFQETIVLQTRDIYKSMLWGITIKKYKETRVSEDFLWKRVEPTPHYDIQHVEKKKNEMEKQNEWVCFAYGRLSPTFMLDLRGGKWKKNMTDARVYRQRRVSCLSPFFLFLP